LPVPLSTLTQSVIGKRQSQGYVFPGPVESTHYTDDGVLHRKVRRESGITDFFPHALRHTAETKLAELRIPPHIRDLLFDHVPMRGSGARYDHYEYGDILLRGPREGYPQFAGSTAMVIAALVCLSRLASCGPSFRNFPGFRQIDLPTHME
jgi:hypothetical protein